MPARPRNLEAAIRMQRRAATAGSDPPSSAVRQLDPAADEDEGFAEEPFLQLASGPSWPDRFHAERLPTD